MRRLGQRYAQDRERGAIAVMVAILMVSLIGFTAFAIDVARMADTKAQLQNGADASALAIASNCNMNPSTCTGNAWNLANQYTPANSLDGSAVPSSVTFPTSKSVTVGTKTPGTGLPLIFARIFGQSSAMVTASATAAWGPPGKGSGFPLAFSVSCYDLKSLTTSVGQVQQFAYKPGMTCTGPSGTQAPGGWGWLDNSNCQTTTSAGQTSIGSDPGNDLPNGCATILQSWVNKINAGSEVDVTFPIFDTVTLQGTKAQYHIIGYATLRIIGWKLGGGSNNTPGAFRNTAAALTSLGINSSLACSGGNDRCVIAQFIRYDTTDPSFGQGSGQDLGTTIVYLSN
ncbi:Tad domain-containing protein [Sinomonas humi]|uniref:Putative Flp pilus-assembly TadG-like N-terminal domain-containing protein n=1 Tax=Sinomonas humi TaxID=1338436 RepID=A0A0B2AN51_9MICC|nr:Tad domain-containing protein [Sinomonas humi]KHL05041.1 hypothetical protein LK10_03575 [Sinomonas humi]